MAIRLSSIAHRLGAAASLIFGLATTDLQAAERRAIALPTEVIPASGCPLNDRDERTPIDDQSIALARRIDSLVAGALEDAGIEPLLRPHGPRARRRCISELALLEMAKTDWVIEPQILPSGDSILVRIVVAEPHSTRLRIVTQNVPLKDLDVRTIVMVSELLSPAASDAIAAPAESTKAHSLAPPSQVVQQVRSPGRGVLTLTSALLGGAVGYSLQRASGTKDLRLTYPLIALGTGIGVAASLIASDEWDVSTAEAWYLSAGMFWPAASGMLLARSYQVKPSTDRYIFGLGGAAAGVALTSLAISSYEVTEGGALVTHSGGAIGLLLGGLVDMTISGKTNFIPWHGMGYGSGIGFLVAGAAATRLKISPSRALFIDMAAGLGALGGAAAGSPLLFVENDFISAKRQRAWLSVVGACAVIGGGIGWHLTRGMPKDAPTLKRAATLVPFVTTLPPLNELQPSGGRGMQLGVQGTF